MNNLVDGVMACRVQEGRKETGQGDVPPHHAVESRHLQDRTRVHHRHWLVPLAQLVLVIARSRDVWQRGVEELGYQPEWVLAKVVVPHLLGALLYQLHGDGVAQPPEVGEDVAAVTRYGPSHCLRRERGGGGRGEGGERASMAMKDST